MKKLKKTKKFLSKSIFESTIRKKYVKKIRKFAKTEQKYLEISFMPTTQFLKFQVIPSFRRSQVSNSLEDTVET